MTLCSDINIQVKLLLISVFFFNEGKLNSQMTQAAS